MKICFVVRSIYSQVTTYTTTHLAFEAHRRGHEVVYTTVNSFSCTDDQNVRATVISPGDESLSNRRDFLDALKSPEAERSEVSLSQFDVVFLRYNPNESDADKDRARNPAIEFGRLLKQQGVLVINDPGGLSKASSKMYLSAFPAEIRAQTLITRSPYKIKEFLKSLKKPAIIKPLNGYGGQDVFFIKNPKEEIRSNIHIGGTRRKVEFTRVEAQIVEMIRPKLIADGLWFVGVDIVGNKLLEINVFCPGGINNINELYGINVGSQVIAELERQWRLWKTSNRSDGFTLIKTG